MTIVYFSDQYWPSISGVSVSVDAFKKQLCLMGRRVILCVPDYPGADVYDQNQQVKDVYRFQSHKIAFNDENRLVCRSERKKIFALLDSLQPKIIHVHTEFALGMIGTSYAKKRKIKLVMTAHTNWEDIVEHYIPVIPTGIAHLLCRLYMRFIYNKSDVLVVPTSIMELLLGLYFVKRPIRVIPTGIDMCIFNGETQPTWQELKERFPILNGKRVLFFAGRLGKEKNIPFLIDVLASLVPFYKNLILVISGDGPARADFEEYAKNVGVAHSVLFTGYIERNNLQQFYSLAEVFVFASKVESQGMVVLEAMACGTPVVAIGKMGTREVMGGDSGGFMVDDDKHEFAENVQVLLNNPEIRHAKAERARRHAESWGVEVQAKKMLKLYRKLLEER
ncbi:MAG: glycosyltransferase [Desulfocapsaceae bacterium]|nr:glycosyltransferase [Desulfocapsaceae bacterium]